MRYLIVAAVALMGVSCAKDGPREEPLPLPKSSGWSTATTREAATTRPVAREAGIARPATRPAATQAVQIRTLRAPTTQGNEPLNK